MIMTLHIKVCKFTHKFIEFSHSRILRPRLLTGFISFAGNEHQERYDKSCESHERNGNIAEECYIVGNTRNSGRIARSTSLAENIFVVVVERYERTDDREHERVVSDRSFFFYKRYPEHECKRIHENALIPAEHARQESDAIRINEAEQH